MNNSEKRAEALAHAAELVKEANKDGRNLEGIAELLRYNHPEEIAESLLRVYFEFTNVICSNPDMSGNPDTGYALYTLKEVYEAFANIQKPSNAPIVLKVEGVSNSI